MTSTTETLLQGTGVADVLTGGLSADLIVGLAGDDQVVANGASDVIYGDFVDANLLAGTSGNTGFSHYAATGEWSVTHTTSGISTMTQSVSTELGEVYSISFDLAANYASGVTSSTVEVVWNGQVLATYTASSGSFGTQTLTFAGTGAIAELTFRAVADAAPTGPVIDTSTPIFNYEKTMAIGGTDVTVKAFAEGQANIYQVINGTLHVFDPQAGTYTKAGSDATVTVNAIGYNIEDDLIYGIAVSNGTDSLGQAVSKSDLIMLDAVGDSYRIGETPYRSWTGDFDQNGNLWAFQSSMDRLTMIDVSEVDGTGAVASQTFKFPKNMVTDQLWDVAYDAMSNSFFGATRPSSEGAPSLLYQIDISAVAAGGEPVFETTQITGTRINGELKAGVPAITFGAAIHDADGNLYIAGNSGDHDMDNSTGSSGGIYKVIRDTTTGTATLELVASSPRSSSNDGTADPRAMDPFTDIDTSSSVLLRDVSLEVTNAGANSYNDAVLAGAGADMAQGGIGEDTLSGEGGNDTLAGGDDDDVIYGGRAPSGAATGSYITYDAQGNRYDAYGNLLPEDNDDLSGGAGQDYLHGGSGHDVLDGGAGGDNLIGGSGLDRLYGGSGDDTLSGGSEADVIAGGDGNDELVGGTGADSLLGEAGRDLLLGGSGADTLDGGSGNDQLDGGVGNDHLDGGQGDDVLKGNSGNDTLTSSQGDNSFDGGAGDDHMTGGSGIDTMIGGSGDDTLKGEGARDILKGGSGNDRLEGGDDKDKLYGGSGNDVILGEQGSDYINAGSGDDVVEAGAGRDKILSGGGNDILSGGDDADWFVFRFDDQNGGTDTILDYTWNAYEQDRLDFRTMDLLSGGLSEADWIASHMSTLGNGDVQISLANYSLVLIDHLDLGTDHFDLVVSGLQL